MPVAAADIVFYGSANMPEVDGTTAGGAIATSVRVIPSSVTLWNTLNDTVEVVSSNAGDTTQTVTVTGRNAAGSIVSDVISLNGTTVVNGVVTFERILKIVISAAHAGTVTIRKATGDTALAAIETGVLTMRRLFYDVASDASGGSSRDYYAKIFAKNTHGTLSLLGATIKENADAESQVTFAVEDAVNDNESVASRLNTAPTGITGAGFGSHTAEPVPGTDLAAGAAIGIWLKLTLPAGDAATKASYDLQINGTTT